MAMMTSASTRKKSSKGYPVEGMITFQGVGLGLGPSLLTLTRGLEHTTLHLS